MILLAAGGATVAAKLFPASASSTLLCCPCCRKLRPVPAGPQRLMRHREVVRSVRHGVASVVEPRPAPVQEIIEPNSVRRGVHDWSHKSTQLNVILLLAWRHEASACNLLINHARGQTHHFVEWIVQNASAKPFFDEEAQAPQSATSW